MVKRMHAGRAAQSGVIAGLLAEEGFTGSPDALEAATGGFMSTLGHASDPAELGRDFGQRWETSEVGFKAYAACASAHTIIDAVLAMRRGGLTADNLQHLRVGMSKSAMNNVGWTYRPGGVVAAQMNGYFAAAVALLDGAAFVEQYADHRLDDPRIIELIRKIEIVHAPALDAGGAATRHAVEVEGHLADGTTLSERIEQRRGSACHPLEPEEIRRKFACTAGTVLSPSAVDELGALVLSLERHGDLGRLSRLIETQ
jgi:2-methylcitrate dehydratase PrpD